ncbi:MAG TPA: tRNA dihydrouridine synthase DusB, partial [Halothiobacillaceae bacterium]|nr:tRNA dihydrouridine synthase DusB [Halothiobacillaceae bacterium]
AQPDLVAELLKATVAAVDVPVSLKIRTGVDAQQINALAIARIAEDAGISLLSIHGRHRAQRYEGQAEYDTIAQVVDVVDIPVLANGDIDSPAKARSVLDHTGAAGIMIGRAALGRPWLFAQIKAALNGLPAPPTPQPHEILALLQKQLTAIYQHYGEQTGVRIARKHWKWYSKQLDIDDAAGFNRLQTASEQHQWLLACAENQITKPNR